MDRKSRVRHRPSQQHLEFKEPKDTDVTKIQPWREPDEDEEIGIQPFSVTAAWNALVHLPSCQQLLIRESIQKNLHIVVGKNVTQEFPWKQVKFKLLQDHFFDELGELGDILRTALLGFSPEHHILMGYAPILTQNNESPDGDPFVLFLNPDDGRAALGIIRNIELFERWKYRKRLVKKPRRWVTMGSEDEVNLTIQRSVLPPVDVEVQSNYPKKFPKNMELIFRFCDDVRDGYVELLPNENIKWENVMRKRVTIGIQASPKVVNNSQQTTPTYPANAWSQYLYTVKEEDAQLDETSDEEVDPEEVKKRHSERQSNANVRIEDLVPKKKEMMDISDTIWYLLKVLDFNQIDIYRNDYPLITKKPIRIFANPILEEKLCFANISRSYRRYVCSTDWYPKVSGLVVVSYTFTTVSTVEKVSHWEDEVQRAVLESKPLLLWSFADNLNFKLELESPCEITTISFCPHDTNVIIGGASNGRIFLWDLQGRADRLEEVEVLTSSQAKYREIMTEYLSWAIPNTEEFVIPASTSSAFEVSQKAPITGVYWMGNRFYINSFGKCYYDPDSKTPHKYFATCAYDTSISFWDLDATAEKRVKDRSREMPRILTQSESVYKHRTLKPVFTLAHVEPLTGLIGDFSFSRINVVDTKKVRKKLINCKTVLEVTQPKETRMSTIASTFYGRIERLSWLGTYSDVDGRETASIVSSFARIHDGPIVSMRRSPFLPSVFVSIGRTVFAIWSESYSYSSLLWRKRSCDLTAVSWSEERPGVLFFTRIDGNLEVWDILSRDDDAVLSDIIGGGIVTAIIEHKPDVPTKMIGIGDYNSSLRMIRLPKTFCNPTPNELLRFKEFARKEEKRKRRIQHWEQIYYERHREFIDAKRQAEIDVRKEFDRREDEERRKQGKEKEEPRKIPLWMYPYPIRMKLIWDQLNLNRMLTILMTRMRVNEVQLEIETRMEKRRLAFEIAKKRSMYAMRHVVLEELASIRSRILPAEKKDLQRSDIIAEQTIELFANNPYHYDDLAEKSAARFHHYGKFSVIPYIEFFLRGEHRRKLLHKALGGNTERKYWLKNVKGTDLMDNCEYGYESFLHFFDEEEEEEEEEEEAEEEEFPEDGIFPISELSGTAETTDIYTPIA